MNLVQPTYQERDAPFALPPWPVIGMIVAFSILLVYDNSVAIGPLDATTRAAYRQQALQEDYRDLLRGERPFPYQWRLLGVYVVYAGERLSGANPDTVALFVKSGLMAIAALVLFKFSELYTSLGGSIAVMGLYFVIAMAAFQDAYPIYYCSDYAMVAAWFTAVYLIRLRRFAWAALVTFIGAWAKETLVLVPVLLGIMYLRKRVTIGPVLLATAAFLVPTIVLRSVYRAPLAEWAWWHMLIVNTPLLQGDRLQLRMTLQYNLKVLVMFNVFWWLGARGAKHSADPFLRDAGLTLVVYLVLAYWVVFIRELRHFLPFAIVLLPAALRDLEHGLYGGIPAMAPSNLRG
jgi:hypothetical protein